MSFFEARSDKILDLSYFSDCGYIELVAYEMDSACAWRKGLIDYFLLTRKFFQKSI